jgi:5-methylcytosine-specific restriction endonuclease McrA
MLRTCTKCDAEKSIEEFHLNPQYKDGRHPWCKACRKAKAAEHYTRNKERRDRENKERNFANRDAKNAKQAEYREANREDIRAKGRAYQKDNRAQYAANTARYKADKTQATPAWLTEDQKLFMNVTYAMANVMTEMTGIKHDVDHIHPLRGRGFHGLHVPWNLQVLTKPENLSKSNKLVGL